MGWFDVDVGATFLRQIIRDMTTLLLLSHVLKLCIYIAPSEDGWHLKVSADVTGRPVALTAHR